MLGKVLGIPRTARRKILVGIPAENVVHEMYIPTAHFLAVAFLAVLAANRNLALHVIEKGLVAHSEIARFGEPVGHLDVDVGVIIAGPGGPVAVVPDALQVGWQRSRTGAGNHHVPLRGKNQRFKTGIGCPFPVGVLALICRQGFRVGMIGRQIQCAAIKQGRDIRSRCLLHLIE